VIVFGDVEFPWWFNELDFAPVKNTIASNKGGLSDVVVFVFKPRSPKFLTSLPSFSTFIFPNKHRTDRFLIIISNDWKVSLAILLKVDQCLFGIECGGFVIKLSKSPSDIKVAVATDKYGLYGMTENLSKIESMTGNVSLGVIWFLEWATSTVV